MLSRPLPFSPHTYSGCVVNENMTGNAGEMAVSQERKLPENISGKGLFLLLWQARSFNKIYGPSPSTKVTLRSQCPTISGHLICSLNTMGQLFYVTCYLYLIAFETGNCAKLGIVFHFRTVHVLQSTSSSASSFHWMKVERQTQEEKVVKARKRRI